MRLRKPRRSWPVLVKKKPYDECESLSAFERNLSEIIDVLGDQTTDENELNEAGLAIFAPDWMGVYASNEVPPPVGYSIQNTRPRTTRDVGHWLARANDLCYVSFGRVKYGDNSAVMLKSKKIRIAVVKCALRGSACTTTSVRSLLCSCRTEDIDR